MSTRTVVPLVAPLVLSALVGSPSLAHATQFALGGGGVLVTQNAPSHSAVLGHLHGRVSWRTGERFRLGLEFGSFTLGDSHPRPGAFIAPGLFGPFPAPDVLGVTALMVSGQFGREEGLYLRPSLGLARHAFATYRLGAHDELLSDGVSHEAGLAAGVAVGRRVWHRGRAHVALEGLGLWSGGEDSSSSRFVIGAQAVAAWGR